MKPVNIILSGMSRLKAEGKCPFCKEPIGDFRNKLSRKEFKISGHVKTVKILFLGVKMRCLDCDNQFIENEAKIVSYESGAVLSKIELFAYPQCNSTHIKNEDGRCQ